MPQTIINTGLAPDDGTGDPLRTAFTAVNNNFTELFNTLPQPGYVSGRRYPILPTVTTTGTAGIGANSIRFLPFPVYKSVTISGLFTRCTTGATGAFAQLALYASSTATGRPTGNILARTGAISINAAGIITGDFTAGSGSNVTLTPGLYFFAINADSGSAQFVAPHPGSTVSSWYTGGTTDALVAANTTISLYFLSYTQTYGTWPDLTGASFTENTGAGCAMGWFKVA